MTEIIDRLENQYNKRNQSRVVIPDTNWLLANKIFPIGFGKIVISDTVMTELNNFKKSNKQRAQAAIKKLKFWFTHSNRVYIRGLTCE